MLRRVIGKQVVELPDGDVARLREGYRSVLVDVGTGDGKHVLHVARQRPDWLVVGLDANRDNMRRAAQRAAARPDRGGQPNAMFVWAAAEQLPGALAGVDEVHVLMPWGSLLRGMLGGDKVLPGLAGIVRPGARLLCTLNLHAWRPPVPEVGDAPEPTPESAMAGLGPAYRAAGWTVDGSHYADEVEIAALATAWSRRLNSSRDRFDVLVLTATHA